MWCISKKNLLWCWFSTLLRPQNRQLCFLCWVKSSFCHCCVFLLFSGPQTPLTISWSHPSSELCMQGVSPHLLTHRRSLRGTAQLQPMTHHLQLSLSRAGCWRLWLCSQGWLLLPHRVVTVHEGRAGFSTVDHGACSLLGFDYYSASPSSEKQQSFFPTLLLRDHPPPASHPVLPSHCLRFLVQLSHENFNTQTPNVCDVTPALASGEKDHTPSGVLRIKLRIKQVDNPLPFLHSQLTHSLLSLCLNSFALSKPLPPHSTLETPHPWHSHVYQSGHSETLTHTHHLPFLSCSWTVASLGETHKHPPTHLHVCLHAVCMCIAPLHTIPCRFLARSTINTPGVDTFKYLPL